MEAEATSWLGLVKALGGFITLQGTQMFNSLIWYLKIIVHVAAFLVVFAGISYGPVVATLLGMSDSGPFVQGTLGALVGICTASVIFGMPIVLININDNVAHSLKLLEKLEKHSRPQGFAASVAPSRSHHASEVTESA